MVATTRCVLCLKSQSRPLCLPLCVFKTKLIFNCISMIRNSNLSYDSSEVSKETLRQREIRRVEDILGKHYIIFEYIVFLAHHTNHFYIALICSVQQVDQKNDFVILY